MKSKANKPKVLVIFPYYRQNMTNHYPYWLEVFEEAAQELDLVILFEGASEAYPSSKLKTIRPRVSFKPFNLFERLFWIKYFRFRGYNQIYIHYGYFSVILSKLVGLVFPTKIFLWDCELYRQKPSNRILQTALSLTDALVTGSPMIGKAYRQVFNFTKPIHIVPNWAKTYDTPAAKFDPKSKHVLFVHHLSARKGVRQLPAIIFGTLEKNPNTVFHIIGSGPDEAWLSQELRQFGSKAKMYGSLTNPQIAAYYKACDVFIMPSLIEGFPRVILEAMAYNLPIVSTTVGNVAELARDYPIRLIEARKPQLFTCKLVEYLENPIRNKKTKQNQYNKQQTVQMFVQIFNNQAE